MENFEIVDRWVDYINDKVEDDIELILNKYKDEFNKSFNKLDEVSDYDLYQVFFEVLNEKYSMREE